MQDILKIFLINRSGFHCSPHGVLKHNKQPFILLHLSRKLSIIFQIILQPKKHN